VIIFAIFLVLVLSGVGYYTLRAKSLYAKNAEKDKKVEVAKEAKPTKSAKTAK
jgi:Na+-transporting methylmalonyl-CoA/oxaloacetate decarboxylase gamma subunit